MFPPDSIIIQPTPGSNSGLCFVSSTFLYHTLFSYFMKAVALISKVTSNVGLWMVKILLHLFYDKQHILLLLLLLILLYYFISYKKTFIIIIMQRNPDSYH